VHVNAGVSTNVPVPLEPLPLTDTLIVALHADKGDANLFNYDMDDKLNSLDQQLYVGRRELAIQVQVR